VPLTEGQTGEAPGDQTPGAKPLDCGTLYRCEHCTYPVTKKHIQSGGCAMCGGRRVKIAVMVKDDEVKWLEEQGYSLSPERWREQADIK
jgi:hypothetical protein